MIFDVQGTHWRKSQRQGSRGQGRSAQEVPDGGLPWRRGAPGGPTVHEDPDAGTSVTRRPKVKRKGRER